MCCAISLSASAIHDSDHRAGIMKGEGRGKRRLSGRQCPRPESDLKAVREDREGGPTDRRRFGGERRRVVHRAAPRENTAHALAGATRWTTLPLPRVHAGTATQSRTIHRAMRQSGVKSRKGERERRTRHPPWGRVLHRETVHGTREDVLQWLGQ